MGYSSNLDMKGAGDLIHKITSATGVKQVVDKVAAKTGKDCGCGKRREKLNNMFPFNKNRYYGNN